MNVTVLCFIARIRIHISVDWERDIVHPKLLIFLSRKQQIFSRIYYARITMKCVPSREPCAKMPRYFAKKNAGLSHKLVKFIAQMEGILLVQRMKSACRSPAGDELCVWSHLLPSTRDISSSLRTEPVHTAPSWIFFIDKQKENGREVHWKSYMFSHFKGWLV